MTFLVDECAGPALARWLAERGYDVRSVYDDAPGISDDEVLAWADRENRVLITIDKDFGELIHRESRPHAGVLLLRLSDERSAAKVALVEQVLSRVGPALEGRFTVATARHIRMSPPLPE